MPRVAVAVSDRHDANPRGSLTAIGPAIADTLTGSDVIDAAVLVATAGAFGRWSDPAYVLVATSPTSSLRILLVRIVASVLPAIALTALSVPWVVDRGWLAIAWLLPSLALAAGALALSSWVDIERAAIGLGLAWLVPPMLLRLPVHRMLELLGTPTQVLSVLALVTAAGVVMARRDTFDHREA